MQRLLQLSARLETSHDVVGQQKLSMIAEQTISKSGKIDSKTIKCAVELLHILRGNEEDFMRQCIGLAIEILEPLEDDLEEEKSSLTMLLESAVSNEDYEQAAILKKKLKEVDTQGGDVSAWRKERSLLLALSLFENVCKPSVIPEMDSLLDRVVLPEIQQTASQTRRGVAVRCLALYCQLDLSAAKKHLNLLILFLDTEEEVAEVRMNSLRAVFDLIMIWGIESITDNSDEVEKSASEDMMFKLLEYLDSDDLEFRLVAAEGLAKLAVVGRLVDVRILQCLLVLYFHPTSESDVRLRQCLAVCFPILAENTVSGRKCIEDMAIPLITTLLHPPPQSPIEEIPFEPVLQFVLYLLSFSSGDIHCEFAKELLYGIAVEPTGKNIRALARGLTALKIAHQFEFLDIQTKYIASNEKFTDSVALRQFNKWQDHLKEVQTTTSPSISLHEEFKSQLEAREQEIRNTDKSLRSRKLKTKKKMSVESWADE